MLAQQRFSRSPLDLLAKSGYREGPAGKFEYDQDKESSIMDTEQSITAMRKALEMWTLQNLCDGAVMLGFVVLALVAARGYLETLKARLSLRVAIEAWETFVDFGADLLLLSAALVGLFVTNLDIMADIKVAVPWVPLGLWLMGVALILRAFHGGHVPGSRAWWTALGLIAAGCVLNWFGFTFVMEAPGDEYVHLPLGETLISLEKMRSNENPGLTMITFFGMAPLYALEFAWAMIAASLQTRQWLKRRGNTADAGRDSTLAP